MFVKYFLRYVLVIVTGSKGFKSFPDIVENVRD